MPLAQWIMQNLQPSKIDVLVGGVASISLTTQTVSSGGGVLANSKAEISYSSVLLELLPYTIGDTVYLSDGREFFVLGYYWNLDRELTYEISNYNETMWVPESMLYRDRSVYYQKQLAIIDQNISALSK